MARSFQEDLVKLPRLVDRLKRSLPVKFFLDVRIIKLATGVAFTDVMECDAATFLLGYQPDVVPC